MTMESEFRYRGVKTLVDTTDTAEFDIASIPVSEETLTKIARNLKALPHSPRDRVVGDVRLREVENLDIVFFITRELDAVVVNIGGVVIPDPNNPTEEVLKKLGTMAILRGAVGI
mgnify:CR=1 FL=1